MTSAELAHREAGEHRGQLWTGRGGHLLHDRTRSTIKTGRSTRRALADAVHPAHRSALPWKQVPVGDRTHDRGHGRVETRTKAVCVRAESAFPTPPRPSRSSAAGAAGRDAGAPRPAYAVTSLAAHQAGAADLAEAIRGHWTVQNRLHWVRDVTFDEDHSQVRTGNSPRIMASLRNLTITVLRLFGVTTVTAALRHRARRPDRPLHTVMNC